MDTQLPIDEIFKAAGSKAELARKLGIDRAAVQQWEQVPAGRCLAVSRITGIPPHRIRPDFYPCDLQAQEQPA